MNPKCTNQNF